VAYLQIRARKGTIHFIYRWAFPIGSFVWEDLFVFSLYGLFATLITLISQQLRLGLLFLIIFWLVRSVGETFYFFLQQFIQPQHAPHYLDDLHFKVLRWFFGPLNKQQCYILLQIFFQVITMVALVSLILTILNWEKLP
jgi:hypothetical protein